MKIEKGKLYYDTTSSSFFKADEDGDNHNCFARNKIAVHCPTKEDWDYVNKVMGWEWGFSHCFVYRLLDDENYRPIDFDYLEDNGYFRMSMEEFKKFYPEVKSNLESFKKSFDIGSALDFIQNKDNINPSHYTSKGIQPIDYIEENGLNFNEGCIIKYLTRYKEKNGLEDLKKAKYYLERLIEGYERP